MEKKTSIYYILIVLVLTSCIKGINAPANYSNSETIVFDINNRNTVCLDRIIDRYSYVKLETNEKCLLGEIDKILFLDIKTSICKKRECCSNMIS